jgi:hypothetical protein
MRRLLAIGRIKPSAPPRKPVQLVFDFMID